MNIPHIVSLSENPLGRQLLKVGYTQSGACDCMYSRMVWAWCAGLFTSSLFP